jgi:hypothetical protein
LLSLELPLLLASLPLLRLYQRPCCTGVVAVFVLSLAIKDASAMIAPTPVQQGRWCGHIMLPLLLVSLPSLHLHQHPRCIGIFAVVALSLAKTLVTEATGQSKMPVQ